MKFPLTNHSCMVCDWEETNHKCFDGWSCPSCGGPLYSDRVSPEKEKKGK